MVLVPAAYIAGECDVESCARGEYLLTHPRIRLEDRRIKALQEIPECCDGMALEDRELPVLFLESLLCAGDKHLVILRHPYIPS